MSRHVARIVWQAPDNDLGTRMVEHTKRSDHIDQDNADAVAKAWVDWARTEARADVIVWVEDYTPDGHLAGRRHFTTSPTPPPAAHSIAAARRSLQR